MKRILYLLFMFLSLVSCVRREHLLQWDLDVALPLASLSVGAEDLLPDSMVVQNSDESLHFRFVRQLKLDSFNNVLQVPDTINEVTVSLQKLILDERTLEDTITLRQIYPQASLLNGQRVDLPELEINNAGGGQTIDVSEAFFKTATFRKGTIEISVFNDLPVRAETLKFRLKNQDDGQIIIEDEFKNIQPGGTVVQYYDLAGKRVNGVMLGEIPEVKTAASDGPVLVEADKGVRLKLRVYDLEPENATAVFPAQTLVADSQEVIYNLGGPKVTSMRLNKGTVIMDVISTIEEEIILDYFIPDSRENENGGAPIRKVYRVPAAPRGGSSKISERFPIDGYIVVFKGIDPNSPPYYNTVFSTLTARIEYSGIERSISLTDSVRVRFGLIDVEPHYATGAFGGKSNRIQGNEEVEFMKKLSGSVNLDDIKLGLFATNTFGLDAGVDVKSFTGINSKTGKAVKLSGSPIANQILVKKAINRPPLIPGRDSFIFTKQNSNLKQFVENLPDQFTYDIQVISSPNGTINLNDFIFSYSEITTDVEIDVPLRIAYDSLRITEQTELSNNVRAQIGRAKSGYIHMNVEHNFPFDIGFSLRFLDADGKLLSEFIPEKDAQIAAAPVDPSSGRTISSREGNFRFPITETIASGLQKAVFVEWSGYVHTPDAKRHPIFSNYKANIQISFEGVYDAEM